MKYKAVVFDLFGTLIDNLCPQEYERVLWEMADALCVPREDFAREWIGTFQERISGGIETTEDAVEHICQLLGVEAAASSIAAAVEIRFDLTRRALRPRPDAVETLTQLKAGGYKIGLVTDCSDEVPVLWADSPLAPVIDVPIFSCSVGMAKPDSRIYLLACEALGVKPQECLYVGDGSSRELTGAVKVGMHPVLISVPYDNDYDHFRVDAKEWQGTVISSLKQILTVVG
ncbi:MAG: HAD-IA family hydrolase [Armatimonadetes bacterium]|nr:HAD-IA family hydrolase [Armatimonadota bacterium]NIM24954.1 HAD-IA family hydrolase [Armatimonadota bacterium]NIM68840.1 HAD-IA family hydrolase [Armatimonadota bacterium]NIM76666.1 HAD-IA family hydrolase [Armatimonadota bacterium]NIN07045.1 HAD-IA family hydrolase [Armatimonadota bacterium]